MRAKITAIAIITLIATIFFTPLLESRAEETVYKWEQWEDSDSRQVELVSAGDIQVSEFTGFTPGASFYCWNPYMYDGSSLQKGYWLSDAKPVKCVWEYYDPHMHKFYRVEKDVAVVYEGDFEGYRYAFADYNEFIIPALFMPDRYGDWAVRSYFIFEGGGHGGEGPVVDDQGNSYMLSFPVVKGSTFNLIFNAPIYLFGHKTIPLFWWLTPVWALVIFFIIAVIYTRSVVGAVKLIKNIAEATRKAKTEWRRR